MCQAVVRRLFNPSERCHVRKVARLLAQALRRGAPPAPEQVEGSGHQRHRDGVVEVVQIVAYRRPVLAEHVPEVRQREDPGYAPEESVKNELAKVHPGGAGGKRDEGTNHGQAAGDEDGELAVLIEPLLGDMQVMRFDADVSPVMKPELTPAPETDNVGYHGADKVPQDPGGHCCEKAHLVLRDQVTREG